MRRASLGRAAAALLLLRLLLVVLLGAGAAHAAVVAVERTIPARADVFLIGGEPFALEAGATFTVDITTTPSTARFQYILYHRDQLDYTLPDGWSLLSFELAQPASYRSEFVGHFNVTQIIQHTNLYYATVATTGVADASVQGTITFYNPVSQHLPANMAPMVQTEATFTALYVVLMTSLLPYIWTTWRTFTWLQALYFVAVFNKILASAVGYVYYALLASEGLPQQALSYVFSISSVAANVFFVAFVMMSSIGYALVRTSVTNREKQLAIFAFILYSVFDLQSTICTDPTLCQAYELALQIVKFLITFGIVVSINSNLHWLFIATTSLHLHPSSLLPLLRTLARIRLLSRLRIIYAVYLLAPIGLLFLNYAVLTWRVDWLPETTRETLAFGVLATVGLLIFQNRDLFYIQPAAAPIAPTPVAPAAVAEPPAAAAPAAGAEPVAAPAGAGSGPAAASGDDDPGDGDAAAPPTATAARHVRVRSSAFGLPLGRRSYVVAEATPQ